MVADHEKPSIQPSTNSVSIVLLGQFNPAIFQPFWFSENGLIRKEAAADAEIAVIHRDATRFAFENTLVEVTHEKAKFETSDPAAVYVLRDLVAGTFSILEHTPISKFGFNSNKVFYFQSEKEWDEYGHHYAPKESWNSLLDSPGLVGITMQGTRDGCSADRIQISTGPTSDSRRAALPLDLDSHHYVPKYGVRIDLNEHYDCDKDNSATVADRNLCMRTELANAWKGFLSYSERVSDHLLVAFKPGVGR